MKKILPLFFLIIFTSTAQSQFLQTDWVWQKPTPQGNWLKGIEVIGSKIVAVGTGSTIIISNDRGLSWKIKTNPLGEVTPKKYNFVRFMSQNLGWVCGDKGTILKTTDGGENWVKQYSLDSINFNKLIFINENIGYACGTKKTLLKTTNGGLNWMVKAISINNSSSFEVKDFYANGNEEVINCGGIYKSSDGGASWQLASINVFGRFKDFQFLNAQSGYLIGSDYHNNIQYLLKTTDSGWNWFQVNSNEIGNGVGIYNFSFLNSNTGFLSTYNGVFRTTDGTQSWERIYEPEALVTCGGYFDFMKVVNEIELFGVNCSKVIGTSNGGINWINYSGGDRNYHYSIQFVNENTGWTDWYKGLQKTTNGGNSWETFDFGLSGNALFHFYNSSTGWLYSGMKTTNGGETWIHNPLLPIGNYPRKMIFLDHNTGYLKGDSLLTSKLYMTTNSGSNWNKIFETNDFTLYDFQFVNNNVGFTTMEGNLLLELYKTTNGGYNWFSQNLFYTGGSGSEMYFYDEHTGWIVSEYSPTSNEMRIYKTTNGGVNFFAQDFENPGISYPRNFHFFNSNTGFFTAYSYFIYTTTGGEKWETKYSGVDRGLNGLSFINEKTGWICGEEGAILKTTNGGGIVGIHPVLQSYLPASFSLSQNYPNPFNPSTIISFDLPIRGNVKLAVYNTVGQEIAVLVNENLSAGTYQYSFDAADLPSGVYFYKLTAGNDYSQTKKMVLLK